MHDGQNVKVELAHPIRIAPTQTRILPIRLTQLHPFFRDELKLNVTFVSEATSITLSVALPVRHISQWTSSGRIAVRASYVYAGSMPTYFLVVPPRHVNLGTPRPPILALRSSPSTRTSLYACGLLRNHSDGAGVDVTQHTFWADALPRQNHSWIILPTGRTSWVPIYALFSPYA